MSRVDTLVSVVAPLRDDADILVAFADDVLSMLREGFAHSEIILVDDGSADGTAEVADRLIAENRSVRLIRLSRRFGTEIAIAAGLDSAIGDYVAVLMPASDPPALVPEMVERCRNGAAIVTGIRTSRHREPWYLRLGANAFYSVANLVLGIGIPRNSTHFKVLSRQAVNAVTRIPDQASFLRTLTMHVGYENALVDYNPISRREPPRNKGFLEALALAVRIVVANSLQPLYFVIGLAALIVIACGAYLTYVIGVYLLLSEVAVGWTTTNALAAVMFGVLALTATVGLLYLARLLQERNDWPLYFVLEERTASTIEPPHRLNVVDDTTLP